MERETETGAGNAHARACPARPSTCLARAVPGTRTGESTLAHRAPWPGIFNARAHGCVRLCAGRTIASFAAAPGGYLPQIPT